MPRWLYAGMLWVFCAGAPVFAQTAAGPSVAVTPLVAQTGVSASTAALVSDSVAAQVQQSSAFSRVLGQREMEATLGIEQQRQLLACSSESCLVEVAEALNVDYLMLGSVGRLGSVWLVNLKLVRARNAVMAAAVSERATGSEDVLLDAARKATQHLLVAANLVAPPLAAAPDEAAPEGSAGLGAARLGLWAGGGIALVGVVPMVMVAVAGLAVAAFMLQGMFGLVVPVTRIPLAAKVAVAATGAGGAAVGVLAALLLGAVGLTLVAVGTVTSLL